MIIYGTVDRGRWPTELIWNYDSHVGSCRTLIFCRASFQSLRHTAGGSPGQCDKDSPNLRYWPGRYPSLHEFPPLSFPFYLYAVFPLSSLLCTISILISLARHKTFHIASTPCFTLSTVEQICPDTFQTLQALRGPWFVDIDSHGDMGEIKTIECLCQEPRPGNPLQTRFFGPDSPKEFLWSAKQPSHVWSASGSVKSLNI